MQNLKEQINAEYIAAFKAKETVKKNLLGVLKGELTKIETAPGANPLTNEDVLKAIKTLAKGVKEVLANSPNDEDVKKELEILESYLPTQMSEQEVSTEISKILLEIGATNPSDMGKVMSAFKVKFDGKADGKLVSTIVRDMLSVKV